MYSPLKLVLVDDDQLLRDHMRFRLASVSGVQVCGEAGTGEQAVDVIRRTPVDCVLLDLQLPDMNGLDVMGTVRTERPEVKFLVLSAYCTEETVYMARKFEAAGCLAKQDCSVSVLDSALTAIATGRAFFPFSYGGVSLTGDIPEGSRSHVDQVLAAREQEVLIRILRGGSNCKIAADMKLSVHTVKNHRNSIMKKFGVHCTGDLMKYAYATGLTALYAPPRFRRSLSTAPVA